MNSKKILIVFQLLIAFVINHSAQDITQGIKLIRNEKYFEAKKYFEAITAVGTNAEAFFYMGQINFFQNKIDSASVCYAKGIQADSEFPLNFAGMYKVNVAKNDLSEASRNFAKAVELSEGKNSKVYITLSEAYTLRHMGNNFNKAVELLQKAVAAEDKNADAFISLGKVYFGTSYGSEAIKNFEEALKIDPKNPEALTSKARIYILIKNFNAAMSFLNEAINNDSSYSTAYKELAELNAELNDYSKAAELYSKYIDASETTPEKLKRLAALLYLNKEYAKTINILQDLTTAEKDVTSTVRILAYSYYKLEDTPKSMAYFQKLFSADTINYLPTDFENYADLLTKTGDDSSAVTYLYKIVEIDSTRKDALSKISVLQFKNKNWDGVITALERKGSLKAQEYFDLGKAYYFISENLLSKAVQDISSSLNLSLEYRTEIRSLILLYKKEAFYAPNDGNVVIKYISKIENLLTKSQKSQWDLIKDKWLHELNASDIIHNYNNADSSLTMLTLKAPELAVAYFWKARVKTNFDPESELGLAKPFYEQFINLAGKDVEKFKKELIEAYSYLGYYYYLQNDNQMSKTNWQEVLNIDPNNKQASEVIKQLK